MEYLTIKNTCWSYEKEWRIINVENQPYTPRFINMPNIKSVIFGVNMDYLCKQLLWDVCKEKGIVCYELELGIDDFSINRRLLSDEDFVFDLDRECEYFTFLSELLVKNSDKTAVHTEQFNKMVQDKCFNPNNLITFNNSYIDSLIDCYFLKNSINRILSYDSQMQKEYIPKEIINLKEQMDNCIGHIKIMNENQKTALLQIIIANLINRNDYRVLLQLVYKIDSLIGKIEELGWVEVLS